MNETRLITLIIVAVFFPMMNVQAADQLDRTVLPIPEPKRPTYKELDVRNVSEIAPKKMLSY